MNIAPKRIILAAAAVLLMLLSAAAFAEDAQISIQAGEINEDGTITVSVSVSGDNSIAGAQFALSYDADALELISAKNGAIVRGGISATNDEEPGSVVFIWSTLMGSKQPGELIQLTFKPKGAAGSTEIKLDDERTQTMIIDEELNELPYTASAATIFLGDAGTPAPEQSAAPTPAPEQSADSSAAPVITPAPSADISMNVGESVAVTPPGNGYVWASSNERVATVDENGNITALADGDATITAISEDGLDIIETQVSIGGQTEAAPNDAPQAAAPTASPAEYDKAGVFVADTVQESAAVWPYLAIAAAIAAAAVIYAVLRRKK